MPIFLKSLCMAVPNALIPTQENTKAPPWEGKGIHERKRGKRRRRGRTKRDQETHFPGGDGGGGNSKSREEEEEEAVRETTTTETGFPSSYRVDVPARGEIFDRELRGEQGKKDLQDRKS